jgi:hypothetical protein
MNSVNQAKNYASAGGSIHASGKIFRQFIANIFCACLIIYRQKNFPAEMPE